MISAPVNLSLHHAVEREYSLKCVSAGGGCLCPKSKISLFFLERKKHLLFLPADVGPLFRHRPSLAVSTYDLLL